MNIPKYLIIFSSILIFFSILPPILITNSIESSGLLLKPKIVDFQPYKFIAFGDTRTEDGDNSGLEKVSDLISNLMIENDIEFIIHTGDMVDNGGDQDEYDDYYWPEMREISEEVPIFYAVGNHEYNHYIGEDDSELTTYKANVGSPSDQIFYSFNSPQNDTHFIILNSALYLGNVNVSQQAIQQTWLENDLDRNNIDRIIVTFHHPLWGANPYRVINEHEPLRAIWHEFFVENNITLVFNGHDHMFYHTVRNGTNYVVTGGGTSALYEPDPTNPFVAKTWLENDYAFSDQHINLVEVLESGFEIQVITPNQTVVYQYSISNAAKDIYSPTISSPSDVEVVAGEQVIVGWLVNDDYDPGIYRIYLNGQKQSLIDETWNSGDSIVYTTSQDEGTYNITIEVIDQNGNSITDTVMLIVTPFVTPTTSEKTPGFVYLTILLMFASFIYFRRKRR